jgi:hypothetical protein
MMPHGSVMSLALHQNQRFSADASKQVIMGQENKVIQCSSFKGAGTSKYNDNGS